jgi:hypothetical protein
MSLRTNSLVSLAGLAVLGAAIGCGGGSDATPRGFGAGTGSSGAAGSGATSGGGGASGYTGFAGASGGLIFPDGSILQDTGTGIQTDAACAAEQRDSTPVKKDIIVLFDNSSSMACPVSDAACTNAPPDTPNPRIGAVRDAINAFVTAPASADVGVGLTAFPPADPAQNQCTWDYSKPDIAIAPAKDNAAQFGTVLAGLTPHLNTPTEQALTGTYTAAKAYIAANPGRSVAVVLVTDGMPFACNNDKTGAISAGLAKAAFDGSPDPVTKLPTAPSIETYVVGLGNTATLDAIALAGTGGVTNYIAANADATQKILDLLKLVSTMITCDYTIPTNGAALDYSFVNVQTRVGPTGTFQIVRNVKDASGCTAAQGGWFYDVNPPGTPTKISLCTTETCDPLKAAQGSALQVLIGCATQVAIK